MKGLPKAATIIGGLVSAAGIVVQTAPTLQQIPAFHGNTLPSIVAIAGLILAMFGTPPHAQDTTNSQG